MPTDDSVKPDPLARTKKQIRFYLSNLHELGQMFIAPTRTADSGGGGGSFESGAWWETLACMRCDVQRAMEGLTDRQKVAIFGVYLCGLPPDDVAYAMGFVYPHHIWRLIRRAIATMAESIGEEW